MYAGTTTTEYRSLIERRGRGERARRRGWRSLWFGGKEPEWFSVEGHPVAVYRRHKTLGNDRAVLLWKHKAEILEFALCDDLLLDGIDRCGLPATTDAQLPLSFSS